MKVKIISCDGEKRLEEKLNAYLKTTDEEIFDIKYSNSDAYSTSSTSYYCSAMIILK